MDDRQRSIFDWDSTKLGLPPQDDVAFHHDVVELSQEARDKEHFYTLLDERRHLREQQLNDGLRHIVSELCFNSSGLGPDPVRFERCDRLGRVGRYQSLDSLIDFLQTFLPDGYAEERKRLKAERNEMDERRPASPGHGPTFGPPGSDPMKLPVKSYMRRFENIDFDERVTPPHESIPLPEPDASRFELLPSQTLQCDANSVESDEPSENTHGTSDTSVQSTSPSSKQDSSPRADQPALTSALPPSPSANVAVENGSRKRKLDTISDGHPTHQQRTESKRPHFKSFTDLSDSTVTMQDEPYHETEARPNGHAKGDAQVRAKAHADGGPRDLANDYAEGSQEEDRDGPTRGLDEGERAKDEIERETEEHNETHIEGYAQRHAEGQTTPKEREDTRPAKTAPEPEIESERHVSHGQSQADALHESRQRTGPSSAVA